jgi:hypothetical protein
MGEDDRRKYKRHRKPSIISFQIIETPEKNSDDDEDGVVVDYSKGGIRFSSRKSLNKNTKIYIKLKSDDWGEELTVNCQEDNVDLLEMIGSVMWCIESNDRPGEFDIGTQFIEMLEQ